MPPSPCHTPATLCPFEQAADNAAAAAAAAASACAPKAKKTKKYTYAQFLMFDEQGRWQQAYKREGGRQGQREGKVGTEANRAVNCVALNIFKYF